MAMDPAQRAELESAVATDPATPGFAALAEEERRAGRAREAERVVQRGLAREPDALSARLVLSLALLDQDRADEARALLGALVSERLAAAGFPLEREGSAAAGVSEAELEVAFREAETDSERLITPNRVAEEALARVDAGASEGLHESVLEPGSAFATATMAEVLARQGDVRGAERIRASLTPRASAPPRRDAHRERRIATLERWLANIRGGRS